MCNWVSIALNEMKIGRMGTIYTTNAKGQKLLSFSNDRVCGTLEVTKKINILGEQTDITSTIDIETLPQRIQDKLQEVFTEIEGLINIEQGLLNKYKTV